MVFNSTQVAPTDVYVVWPKTKYLTAKTRLVIDTLVEQTPQRMSHSYYSNTTQTSAFSALSDVNALAAADVE